MPNILIPNMTPTVGGGKEKRLFKNQVELDAYVYTRVLRAQKETLEELIKILLKVIKEEVYKSDGDSQYYNRTESLMDKENWNITRVYRKGNNIYGSIEPTNGANYYNEPATEDNRGQLLVHNSPMNYDKRKFYSPNFKDLIKIIENGLSESKSIVGSIEGRPFWDKFLEEAKVAYPSIFASKCRKYGVPLHGHYGKPSARL